MSSQLALLGGTPTVTDEWPPWPDLGLEDENAVLEILRGRRLSLLRREGIVAQFEDAFAAYVRAEHALSFSSGTAALHAACFAAGVGPGDEVLTPSHTWVSAITAILHGNGTPVFCDVAKDTVHIDPEEIRRKATPNTRAVIVCHAWGVPAPMDEIMQAAQEANLLVIEDASHATGGTYRGKHLGTIGDLGCFSLQGTKALVGGEAGVLVTGERLLYERAMVPGHHDARLQECLTEPSLAGYEQAGAYWKYRAAPLELAVAHAQLARLDGWNSAKQENYSKLEAGLRELPFLHFSALPPDSARGFYGSPCLYDSALTGVSRSLLLEALEAEGALVFSGYGKSWYQVPLFKDMRLFRQHWIERHANGVGYSPLPAGALPHTESLDASILVLPSWGRVAPDLVDQYIAAFRKVARNMGELVKLEGDRQCRSQQS